MEANLNRTCSRGARLSAALALTAIAALVAIALPASSAASAADASSASAVAAKKQRVGGKVHQAWPYSKRGKPTTSLGRWLARQAGPTCPKAKRGKKGAKRKRAKCVRLGQAKRRKGKKGRSSSLAVPMAAHRRDRGAVATVSAAGKDPLALTRSYQIPVNDPSYNRLLNWSWTYDTAATAAAFAATGEKSQARQLLDQLTALQFKDGSIDIAFDVASGKGAGMYRAGTVAWLGLATTTYDREFHVGTFRNDGKRAADYLLSLRGPSGLVRGGPGIGWYSTQHNILAYTFLGKLAVELYNSGEGNPAAVYATAAHEIGEAIERDLLVSDAGGTRFRQGLGDDALALDVQALGAMFLKGRNKTSTANAVLSFAKTNFAVSGRSIVKSTNPATYNNTYAAAGPFSGYRPYASAAGPDVLWFEGTPMMRQAQAALGQSVSTIDGWISSWRAITSGSGGAPLQSDKTVENAAFGVEYHVWPAAAPAAWVLLSQGDPGFFTAIL